MKMRSLALKENGTGPLQKAFDLIRESIPFPAGFLYVCIHPERIDLDPAILQKLHKSNLSQGGKQEFKNIDAKIAIVGSGPAGPGYSF